MALLTLSFGLAAQLPLLMGVLSYTEIVPYETFRDKWRHAVVGIVIFGALFSPPDPFTQVMWAMPMVILYVFSLGLAKVVTNVRRRRGEIRGDGNRPRQAASPPVRRRARRRRGRDLRRRQPGRFRLPPRVRLPDVPVVAAPQRDLGLEAMANTHGLAGEIAVGLLVSAAVGFVVRFGYTIHVLQQPVYPRADDDIRRADTHEDVDFETLAVEDIDDVSVQVFHSMSEDQALEYSRQAMYDDDREKAQAILDRFDSIETADDGGDAAAAGGTASAAQAVTPARTRASSSSSTAAGMLDPFTEEETDEDDIGGYAYDIAFIFNSLTSKVFRIVGLFMVVMGGTFFWLYSGGLGDILRLFLDRVPQNVLDEVATRNDIDPSGMDLGELIEAMDIVVALHPVEVLIFEAKVSALAGLVATLPVILFYAWPAAKERGLVYGDRRTFVVWGGGLLVGFAVGTYLGFFWVAPTIISYLVSDAISNGMVISYRIKSFFWLVIATTVGIGFPHSTSSSRWRCSTSAASPATARCSSAGGPSSSASSSSPPSLARRGSS